MSRRPSSRFARTDLAAWLFADLFLVLFIVALLAAPTRPAGGPPGVAPRPTAQPAGVNLNGCVLPIATDGAGSPPAVGGPPAEALIGQVSAQLRDQGLTSYRVGMLLTFASGSRAQIQPAINLATAVNTLLTTRLPAFSGAYTRPFWRGGRLGDARIEAYFYVPPGTAPPRCAQPAKEDQ